MKKFLSVFVKTAAVIASVAGIAYVVKQVLTKKRRMIYSTILTRTLKMTLKTMRTKLATLPKKQPKLKEVT